MRNKPTVLREGQATEEKYGECHNQVDASGRQDEARVSHNEPVEENTNPFNTAEEVDAERQQQQFKNEVDKGKGMNIADGRTAMKTDSVEEIRSDPEPQTEENLARDRQKPKHTQDEDEEPEAKESDATGSVVAKLFLYVCLDFISFGEC